MKRTVSRARRGPQTCSLAHLIAAHEPDDSLPFIITRRWGYACLRTGAGEPYACVGVFSPELSASQRLLLRLDVKARTRIVAGVLLAGVAILFVQLVFASSPQAAAITSAAFAAVLLANSLCRSTARILERYVAYTACDLVPSTGAPLESLLARIAALEGCDPETYARALRALYEDVAAWPRWATVHEASTSALAA